MDTTTVIAITGSFLRSVGEIIADVKRQDLASINLDLLRLKRTQLAEKLDDFKSQLVAAVKQQKGRVEQDLISRGLGNTTVRGSMLRAVERDASTEVDRATREYNRAIEEIALLERKVTEQSRRWWRTLLRCCRTSRE
jgi:hypothetical protein